MKKALSALVVGALLAAARPAHATPSTTFWTPETIYTQPYLVPHITYDTYVAQKGLLQNTYGLTMGVLPFEKLQGEIGFDLFYPTALQPAQPAGLYTADLFQLNARLTLPEGALAAWAPGVSVGIANAGFKKDVSDYDLLHLSVGKTLGVVGAVAVGGYYGAGSSTLWTGSDGKVNRSGFMASWTSADIKIGKPGLDKIIFLADLSTGKNWFGAVGGGIGLYFTPAIDILTGPVYLLDKDLYKANPLANTNLMWTVQLDVDLDFHTAKKAE
jgi:hypothetical protein